MNDGDTPRAALGKVTLQRRLVPMEERTTGCTPKLDREPERHTTVTVVPVVKLDSAFSSASVAPRSPAPEAEFSGKRLLVAGLAAEQLDALRAGSWAAGLQWAVAEGVEGLLSSVVSDPPNALLLSLELPRIHGLEVCRQLREQSLDPPLPIVAVSAVHRGWRFAADLQANFGVEHFFSYPVNLPRLQQVLRCVLRQESDYEDPSTAPCEAEGTLQEGMLAYEHGDLDAAIACLEAGVSSSPCAFQMQYQLGLLYGRRGDLFSAMSALETALQLQPRYFSALKNLAVVYQRAGFLRKTTATWERAMWNAPDEDTRATIKEHMLRLL